MENELTVMIKGLKILYDRADSEPGFRSAIFFADSLRKDMEFAEYSKEEIYDTVYLGFFARYYLVRKYVRTAPMIGKLEDDVSLVYRSIFRVKYPTLSIKYGYLLSVILTELGGDPVGADAITAEIRELAKISDDPASLLRVINAHGLREKSLGNFEEAIEVFSQVQEYIDTPEIPDAAVRHIANIVNNRGLTKLEKIDSISREEGDITIPLAMEDLIQAGRYYLGEKEIPIGHLQGILNRFDKARKILEKLSELTEKSSYQHVIMKTDEDRRESIGRSVL